MDQRTFEEILFLIAEELGEIDVITDGLEEIV